MLSSQFTGKSRRGASCGYATFVRALFGQLFLDSEHLLLFVFLIVKYADLSYFPPDFFVHLINGIIH